MDAPENEQRFGRESQQYLADLLVGKKVEVRLWVHGLTKMERPFSLNGTLLFEYGTIRHPEVLLKRNDHRTKSEHRSLKTERA